MTTAYPKLVVVDDTDPAILYSPANAFALDTSGQWDNLSIGGPVHNHTVHQLTAGTNGTATFTFNGTFARANVGMTSFTQIWACTIDGRVVSSYSPPDWYNSWPISTNFLACDTQDIISSSYGSHTFTIYLNFSSSSLPNATFWLDSIEYAPFDSDPLDGVVLKVDHSDPSLTYSNSSGYWLEHSNLDILTYQDTSMGFTFNGSSVSLYSVLYCDASGGSFNQNSAFYAVDGANSKSTQFILPASRSVDNCGNCTTVYNVPMFNASGLGSGQHHLEVGISQPLPSHPQWLSIEYFLITTHSSAFTSIPPTPTTDSNIGAIIGGAVGGTIALIALILGLFLYRRHKDRKNRRRPTDFDISETKFMGPQESPPVTSPSFQYSTQYVHPTRPRAGSDSEGMTVVYTSSPQVSSPLYSPSYHSMFHPESMYVQNSTEAPSPVAGSSEPVSSTSPPRIEAMKNAQKMLLQDEMRRNSEMIVHVDSGVRVGRPRVDVPPTYTLD